jgi:hypothetical protein
VNHELIKNKDFVVWYGAHFTHNTKHDDDAAAGHIVGPDLRPLDYKSNIGLIHSELHI